MLRYFEFGRGSALCADQRAMLRAPSCPLFAALLVVVFSCASSAQAVTLKSGDIVITADMSGQFSEADSALLRVDPLTGDRTIISDATHGAGPMFQVGSISGTVSSGISRVDDGRFLVAAQNGIFYVNPATGDRTQLSVTPSTSAVAVGNQIFAVNNSGLISIDPTTGAPSRLANVRSGLSILPWDGGLLVGGIESLARFDLDGSLIQLYASGLWTLSMAPYGNNSIVTGGYNGPALVDFNIPFPMGTGSYFSPITSPNLGIGVGADGMVWLAVTQYPRPPFNAIIGFDPHWDGDPWSSPLTILSDATHGSGPTFYSPTGLYVVPEPSSLVLASLCLITLLGFRAHSR